MFNDRGEKRLHARQRGNVVVAVVAAKIANGDIERQGAESVKVQHAFGQTMALYSVKVEKVHIGADLRDGGAKEQRLMRGQTFPQLVCQWSPDNTYSRGTSFHKLGGPKQRAKAGICHNNVAGAIKEAGTVRNDFADARKPYTDRGAYRCVL